MHFGRARKLLIHTCKKSRYPSGQTRSTCNLEILWGWRPLVQLGKRREAKLQLWQPLTLLQGTGADALTSLKCVIQVNEPNHGQAFGQAMNGKCVIQVNEPNHGQAFGQAMNGKCVIQVNEPTHGQAMNAGRCLVLWFRLSRAGDGSAGNPHPRGTIYYTLPARNSKEGFVRNVGFQYPSLRMLQSRRNLTAIGAGSGSPASISQSSAVRLTWEWRSAYSPVERSFYGISAANMDSARSRKVLMGTCGWSDHTLLRCGRFYPASVRSAEDRLQHYSRHFPCVEVDTSTYAIPSPVSVGRWVNAVIPGFLFHFKAFGLFCSKTGAVATLPYKIKNQLGPSDDQNVRLYGLPSELRDELWDIFNSALQPAYQAGRLGVVVFQFHLSFKPSEEHRSHVLWCRKNLDSRYPMAVEFRSRDWLIGEQMSKTGGWLASNNIALIAADELRHETFQKDREQTGLPPGQEKVVLPVAWPSNHPDFLYIRVHRREGTQRVLADKELRDWETRLVSHLPPDLKGPIYFMWGTDWEDQPLINAKRLAQRLPKELIFDWKLVQKPNNRLQSMFMAVSKAQQSPNLRQSHDLREDSTCLPRSTGTFENLEHKIRTLSEDKSALIGDEQRVNCSSSDQPVDEPQLSPVTPVPSVELSKCPKTASDVFPENSQFEVQETLNDVHSKKRVALSNPPGPTDGEGLCLSSKPVSRKMTDFAGANNLSKKGGPVKKRRAGSTITPTITSFFKPAAPTDS